MSEDLALFANRSSAPDADDDVALGRTFVGGTGYVSLDALREHSSHGRFDERRHPPSDSNVVAVSVASDDRSLATCELHRATFAPPPRVRPVV